ncbi:MAG: hypothetical protein KGH58_03880 [Candidatus Micrarchaeota archaeon]|nr:hypothetical protein [Candidatus Micrarchaeota archaeon]
MAGKQGGRLAMETDAEWERPWVSEGRRRSRLLKRGMPLVRMLAQAPLHTSLGDWTYMVFGDYASGRLHTLMAYGRMNGRRIAKNTGMLVRVHSSCATSELFHATNCECREELDEAMRRIRRNGSGIMIYLDQEGAGNGLVAKTRAYAKAFGWSDGRVVQRKRGGKPISIYKAYRMLGYGDEARDFGQAAAMLKSIGVRSVRLMTNNMAKVSGLEREGIKAVAYGIHIRPKDAATAAHIRSKAEELGHRISERDWKRK